MTITKTTVLDLEPVNANWVVTVEREDYSDPGEAPGILLSVGRTTVMLTPAEARRLGKALIAATLGARSPVMVAQPAERPRVVDLAARLEESIAAAKAARR